MTVETTLNGQPINLALQGGGSHGAFTWGVLDYLLEHGQFAFEGVSGASAGAMNAIVLASGLASCDGSRDHARETLHRFWERVSKSAQFSPIKRNPLNVIMGDYSFQNSPSYLWFDLVSRVFSPYQLNLSGDNVLRDVLDQTVDWERLNACDKLKLFISATNVHTGRVRVFDRAEVTTDAVLASACLPQLFQAIEIDGVPYWDGGFAGNPPLFPFFTSCATDDILLVQINPLVRTSTPKTAHEIQNRVNEITFNQSLMKELRAINFVKRLISEGKLDTSHYSSVRIHKIDAEEELLKHDASSKLNAEWSFLTKLRDTGRKAAETWIKEKSAAVGHQSSVDLTSMFE